MSPTVAPRLAALVLATCPGLAACQTGGTGGATVLALYDFERSSAVLELPGRLDEISGLAMSPDGRLFAHNDERATVHEIDPSAGEVGKRFSAGDEPLRGEDLADWLRQAGLEVRFREIEQLSEHELNLSQFATLLYRSIRLTVPGSKSSSPRSQP